MKACIDSLQKELAKVEAMAAAAHRADFESYRAQHLAVDLLKATADAMAARESTARLEGEPSGAAVAALVATARRARTGLGL